MKRLVMAIGVWLLVSGIPAWGQSVSALTVRQQADAATAKAQSDAAAAKAQSDAAAARLREAERAAARQEIIPNLSVELQNSLNNLPTPFAQVTSRGGYNVVLNTSRTNDPLSALQVAPGTWWNNADTATRLNLTKDQQKKMDDIFQQFRLTLIDLNAALSKEELIMDPLIAAERLDEVKILAQIDRIAQARAELEKANSRMLLAIRQSLTMEQWTKIQASPGTFRVGAPRR
jgi:Spy/CpxP family protein refolding chaperone